jgi:hypothetical protein
VGLPHKLNAVDTHSLKPPGSNPCEPSSEKPVSEAFAFANFNLYIATAGQLAEYSLISEPSRLRLQQKRRVLQESVESFAETEEKGAVVTVGIWEENVQKELGRAGAISALALLGAVGLSTSNQVDP